MRLLLSNSFTHSHDSCRNSCRNRAGWYVAPHDSAGCNYCPVANGDVVQNDDPVADPNVVAYDDVACTADGLISHLRPNGRAVVVWIETARRCDLNVATDSNRSLVSRKLTSRLNVSISSNSHR